MKIRTDYVTNSSSSSFIAIKVKTADKTITEALDSGNVSIVPNNGGCFDITEQDLNEVSDIKQILNKMCKWFYETLEDPFCFDDVDPSWLDDGYDSSTQLTWDDCREILRYYGERKSEEIQAVEINEIKSICFFSRMEYYDEPFGACLIEFDNDTKQMTITKAAEPDYDLSEQEREETDFYGDALYDRFLNSYSDSKDNNETQIRNVHTEVPDGYHVCSACKQPYPETEMETHMVRGKRYWFCKRCSDDFFEESNEDKDIVEKVQGLCESGISIDEIIKITGISKERIDSILGF